MWGSLFLVLALLTAGLSSLPNPTNVTFTSVNLRNILRWTPGKDTPAHTKYRIRVAIYGDLNENEPHGRPVHHCTDITRTWCDLSKETSDLEHGYYAKVRAMSKKNNNNSKWVWTEMRFDPKFNTEFGPPHVSVEVGDKYAVVTMEGPMRYVHHNRSARVSMATVFPDMMYSLSIRKSGSARIHHFLLPSNKYKYRIMDHGTEICFSAGTQLKLMSSKHQSSAWHCFTTPEVPLIDRLERIVIISTAVPAVLLCLLAAGSYLLYKYLLGKDQRSPVILTMPPFYPPPLLSERSENIMIVTPIAIDDMPKDKLYPKLPNSSPASQKQDDDDYDVVKNKAKEIQIIARSSGSVYASKNPSPSTNPVSLNQSEESNEDDAFRGQVIQESERSDNNEEEIVVSSDYALQNVRPVQPSHNLPDDYGFVSPAGYAAQNTRSAQPSDYSDDSYGLVGLAPAEEEDLSCLQINWSPSTQRLVIPGLDMETGQEEGGSPPRNRVHLDTVFVRQPSEEEALLGAERGQWETEEFMAKWDLVLLND